MVESMGFEGIAINVWLVWMVPFIGAALIPALAKKSTRFANISAVGFAIISALFAATLIPLVSSGSEIHSQIPWISALNIKAGILADPLSIIMTNLVAWISSLIIIYSVGYMHGDRDLVRYWFFMLFFIGSMQLIVLSDNLLMVFFGWEGVGFASYALIGFWYADRKKDYVGREGHIVKGIAMWASPTHAGIKAFLMTRAGDVMMLSGMFLIFMYAGTFGFKELLADQTWAHTMMEQNLLVPAAVLLFGGAIGKSAQFPLNEWLLEAMTGPTPVSALIHAATMVKAGVFLIARIGPLFFALAAFDAAAFFEVVAWIGAITAFLLATQAIVNPEIKKVLAYSTGSQIGYMMMALGIAGLSTQFVDGYTAGFFHLMSHAMFKASLFMAAGAILHVVGSRFMKDMGGLRKNMNKTFLFMLLSALSLASAPLITSGFWSKDAIFAALLESGTSTGSALFFIAFIFEEEIHSIMATYLFSSFGIGEAIGTHNSANNIEQNPAQATETLNPIAFVSSFVAFGIGSGLGILFYIIRKKDPEIISRYPILKQAWSFLYNRWYLNSLLYWGFVKIPLRLYQLIWIYFENIIAQGINPALQFSMSYLSKVVKYTQTGVTQTYLFVFAAGIIVVLIMLYL